VPVVYTLLDDAAAWVVNRKRGRTPNIGEVGDLGRRPVPEAAGIGD
jgi:hypothetical protein